MAQLHTCRPQLQFERPFVEDFKIAFETDLLHYLEILSPSQPQPAIGRQKLHKALQPYHGIIPHHLQRLKELQTQLRQRMPPMVICHTDLHGGNLMTAVDGKLYLLDWENAMIAPQEHDLFFWAGDAAQWESFWPVYQGHTGFPPPNIDVLEFYFLRRALEDIADFIQRILRADGDDRRNLSDIQEIVGYLNWLPKIRGNLARFE